MPPTKSTSDEDSRECKERKELIRLQRVADKERHGFKMEELKFIRESEATRHDLDLQRQRIKSAEIRRASERREFSEMRRSQNKP